MTIKISLENQNSTIIFTPLREWNDDEVEGMIAWFFTRCSQCISHERILGADRFSERFRWQSNDYFLHFEGYSQSVWIELMGADLPGNQPDLAELFQYISNCL